LSRSCRFKLQDRVSHGIGGVTDITITTIMVEPVRVPVAAGLLRLQMATKSHWLSRPMVMEMEELRPPVVVNPVSDTHTAMALK